MKKEIEKKPFMFWLIKKTFWLFYHKMKIEGLENLPDEPAIVIGNHSQLNGPVSIEEYYPREGYTWCIGEMMDKKLVPDYAYKDFWSSWPAFTHPFCKLLARLIARPAAFLMTNASTIAVFKDKRVMYTFKDSVDHMKKGADVIIFPECLTEHNNIVHEFQRGFVDVARLYYKQTGKDAPFVPLYICPKLSKLVFGKPIYYNNAAEDKKAEAERICNYLMDEISEIAYSLPEHRVVPYPNVSPRHFPKNTRPEESSK